MLNSASLAECVAAGKWVRANPVLWCRTTIVCRSSPRLANGKMVRIRLAECQKVPLSNQAERLRLVPSKISVKKISLWRRRARSLFGTTGVSGQQKDISIDVDPQ
jgi:hypothetical protein